MSQDTEREAFEEAARKEWDGKSIPDAAWIGWQLRAALASQPPAGQRTIDKSELKRLVCQVFGEEYQIVHQGLVPEHTHQCLNCLHAYTPRAGSSEDCPRCGFDGGPL